MLPHRALHEAPGASPQFQDVSGNNMPPKAFTVLFLMYRTWCKFSDGMKVKYLIHTYSFVMDRFIQYKLKQQNRIFANYKSCIVLTTKNGNFVLIVFTLQYKKKNCAHLAHFDVNTSIYIYGKPYWEYRSQYHIRIIGGYMGLHLSVHPSEYKYKYPWQKSQKKKKKKIKIKKKIYQKRGTVGAPPKGNLASTIAYGCTCNKDTQRKTLIFCMSRDTVST